MKRNIIIIITLMVAIIASFIINKTNESEKIEKHSSEEVITTKLDNYTFKIKDGVIANCVTCDISTYDNKKVLYYKQTYELYLCQKDDCYTIKQVLDNNMTTLDDILSKAKDKDGAYDGGSAIYYFDKFNVVKCHRNMNDGTVNTNVYFGDKTLTEVDVCEIIK